MVTALKLTQVDGAVRFEVHAKPRAKKSRLVGLHGEALDVSLAAPPVDGAANDALVELLAKVLSLSKRDVGLVRGASSRTKLVEVRGLDVEAVRARLAAALE